jgi:hypothetical protein
MNITAHSTDSNSNYLFITFLLANVELGTKGGRKSVMKNIGNIIRRWEESHRGDIFSKSGIPSWLVEDFKNIEIYDNYRADSIFVGDVIFSSFVLSYKVWISNKSFNRLKLQNSDIVKYVNNNNKDPVFALFHESYVEGLDFSID